MGADHAQALLAQLTRARRELQRAAERQVQVQADVERALAQLTDAERAQVLADEGYEPGEVERGPVLS